MDAKNILNIQEDINRVAEAYITSIILPFQAQTKQMEELFASVQKMMAGIDTERIFKLKKRLDNLDKSDFDYKWLRSISIPFANKLMECHEKGGNKEVKKFLIELFRDESDINAFKKSFENHPVYKERKEIIDDCLQAHLEGKFTLSIPVLLAQCDGIVINRVKKNKIYSKKDKPNMGRVAREKRIDLNKHIARHLTKIYESRRIEILHGMNPHYFKNKKNYGEELSVKAIWTLFEIINITSEMKKGG